MHTTLKQLINDLMYLRQLNNDDASYVDAINDIIKKIDDVYIPLERVQIEKAYEQGCRIYRNFESWDIKGSTYYDKVFD